MAKENSVARNFKTLVELGFHLTYQGHEKLDEIIFLLVCRFLRNGGAKSLESLKKRLDKKV